MVSSRRQQNVDETVLQLKQEGLTVAGCVCHVGNPEHIKRLIEVSFIVHFSQISGPRLSQALNAVCSVISQPQSAIIEPPSFGLHGAVSVSVDRFRELMALTIK